MENRARSIGNVPPLHYIYPGVGTQGLTQQSPTSVKLPQPPISDLRLFQQACLVPGQ